MIFTLAVFDGKSDRSLPHPEIRANYPHIWCRHSTNHWSNRHIQADCIERAWKWVVADYAKKHNCSLDEAASLAVHVHLIDCWPPNLTDAFRAEVRRRCPGTELMYIAAGATGKDQVGFAMI